MVWKSTTKLAQEIKADGWESISRDKFKILTLTTSYPSDVDDPSGIFVAKLLAAIGKRGHLLKVVAPSNGLFHGRRTLEGIETVRFGYFFPRSQEKLTTAAGGIPETMAKSRLARIQLIPMMALFLIKALIEVRDRDLIYANWLGAGMIGTAVKTVTGKPLVVSFRGDDGYLARDRKIWRALTTWVIRRSDVVAPASGELRNILMDLGTPEHKLQVPRRGVDLEMFYPEPREATDEIRIIYVGAVIRKKGVHDLLAALADPAFSNTRLIIVGGGADAPELMALAERLQMNERVDWMGGQAPEDTARLMRGADILCLPSYTEGRPNVINEAMASGIPVVATRVGGITEMTQEGETGLLHDPGDVAALRQCLSTLVENPALRREMGRRAFEGVVKSQMSWDTTALDFESIFTTAMNGRQRAHKALVTDQANPKYATGPLTEYFKELALKIGAFMAPCLVSLGLFLILFNNWDRVGLTLTVIMCANAALLLFWSSYKHAAEVTSSARLASWFIIIGLAGWIGIETLFPSVLPGEYAQTRNSSQSASVSSPDRDSDHNILFSKDPQDKPTPATATGSDPAVVVPMSWHKDGGRFMYNGRQSE
jgi:colanic acid/amylovoran biosynthesis glycosyltransferase